MWSYLPFADTLFSDFLLAENEPQQSNTSSPTLSSQRSSFTASPQKSNTSSPTLLSQRSSFTASHRIKKYSSTPTTSGRSENPSSAGSRFYVISFMFQFIFWTLFAWWLVQVKYLNNFGKFHCLLWLINYVSRFWLYQNLIFLSRQYV